MPQLKFNLFNPSLRFYASDEVDVWSQSFDAQCVKKNLLSSFDITSGNRSWNGFDLEVRVLIKQRPSRSEVHGKSAYERFDENDEYRDIISISLPESEDKRPSITIEISLPRDACKIISEFITVGRPLMLAIQTVHSLEIDYYEDDNDIFWDTDKSAISFLTGVSIDFSPDIKTTPEQLHLSAQEEFAKTLTAIDQVNRSVERVAESVSLLHSSVRQIAWALLAVLIIISIVK